MNLFRLDSLPYKIATKVYQILLLSLLWYVTSLPLLTIGASTSALFYASSKIIRDEDPRLIKDFMKGFKDNFFKSTMVYLVLLVVGLLFVGNMKAYMAVHDMSKVLMAVQILMIIELAVVVIYSFPIISRYDLNVFKTLKAALLIGNRHVGTTVQSLIFIITALALVGIYPTLFVLLIPGIIGISNYYIINTVLIKYTTIEE